MDFREWVYLWKMRREDEKSINQNRTYLSENSCSKGETRPYGRKGGNIFLCILEYGKMIFNIPKDSNLVVICTA